MFKYWKLFVVTSALIMVNSITYALQIREKAPEFTLPNISQTQTSLSDYQGKVIILDFWDTWCPPCRMEIPNFVKMQKEWGGKGLQIIGMALGRRGLKAVQSFAKDYKINYPIVIVDNTTLGEYGPIAGIPTTFVVGQNGKIYKKYIGYREKGIFEEDIKNLLQSKTGQ